MVKMNRSRTHQKVETLKMKNSKPNVDRTKKNVKYKRLIKKKILDKKEFITDLSFIDKYEEEEKKRMLNEEKENNIKNRNKKIYKLKFCYRPLTNNIELIGSYVEKEEAFNDTLIKSDSNKCCYLLNKDNHIVVPIAIKDILNNDLFVEKKNSNEKCKIFKNKSLFKKKLTNPFNYKFNDSLIYLHLCKKNLINCLLINNFHIINYINIFLSGNYTGFFEENNNDQKILKVDNFNIFPYNNNIMAKNETPNFDIIGKGKDEYGEYIIKGNMSLINDLNQYHKENYFLNEKQIDNKVINFGEINFKKTYNI